MVRLILFAIGATAACAWWASGSADRAFALQEQRWGAAAEAGDLIFQDIECGERCALIRELTDSRYSHVGVVVGDGEGRVVWEALGPVGPTPLAQWARRGIRREVAIYRPVAGLRGRHGAILRALRTMAGRPYDADYQWDDGAIYCSELVAKAYAAAMGEDLIAPHAVDLGRHAARVATLSGGRLTAETLMVTPADLVRSGHFVRIVDELD